MLRGESKPRELTVMMSQAYPRFSTQWATDPYQQLCYLAVRKWGRLHSPGAILGVYTPDELDGEPAPEKFMGPAEVVQPAAPACWPDDVFKERLKEWRKAIAEKRATADAIVAKARTKHPLTPEQEKAIREPIEQPKPAQEATDAGPVVTFAQVAEALVKAQEADAVAVAEDLIGAVADPEHRAELVAKAAARRAELSK
jgi:hypothetical protein